LNRCTSFSVFSADDVKLQVPKSGDVDLSIIARGTPGFSGADLANLINVAALKAAMDGQKDVSMVDVEFAKDKIMMGSERKSAVISEESRRLTAYHEGGHALVAIFTEAAVPVHKATIVPRGMALGMVTQLPDKDETSFSRKQMLARLDVCMGGRVAEELVFGEGEVRGVPILLSSSLLSIYTVISCLLFFFVFTMMEHFGIAHNDIFRHC
jgi:ATP-dependent metalloprotease